MANSPILRVATITTPATPSATGTMLIFNFSICLILSPEFDSLHKWVAIVAVITTESIIIGTVTPEPAWGTASWTEQEVDWLTAAVLRLPGASRWYRKTSMNELTLAMCVFSQWPTNSWVKLHDMILATLEFTQMHEVGAEVYNHLVGSFATFSSVPQNY
jgi:hypothetical protein